MYVESLAETFGIGCAPVTLRDAQVTAERVLFG
jgi:hypothetical protein